MRRSSIRGSAALARELPDRRHLKILDNRLYDLIPHGAAGRRLVRSRYETPGAGGPAGEALTAIEVARDPDGVMPRILGVNHHPGDRQPARAS